MGGREGSIIMSDEEGVKELGRFLLRRCGLRHLKDFLVGGGAQIFPYP